MLDSVAITNFKSLRQVEMSFPRLTLLYGANSSGKSSVFQILLAIKQTIESRNVLVPLVLSGRYAQLGSYENAVYGGDTSLKIGVEFKISLPRRWDFYRPRRTRAFQRTLTATHYDETSTVSPVDLSALIIGFTLEYVKSTRRIKLAESWVSDAKHFDIIRVGGRTITRLLGQDVGYRLRGRTATIGNRRFAINRRYFFPEVSPESYSRPAGPELSLFDFDFFRLRMSLESEFSRNMLYLGPLREYPKRYYLATGEVPRDIGLKGENVVELLYYDSKLRKRKARRVMINDLKRWLETFGLAREVRIDALHEGLYSLILEDPSTGFPVNVSDTGFGVSQILPVVVECLSSPRNCTIMIEQPEIHVHPKVQAELGDLFIEASKDRRIIVETHSEHLLLRVQRRIAEKLLSPNEVAIYFFEPSHEGTQIRRLAMDESGSIKEWPAGFFEEDYQESLARYKATLGREEK